MNLAWEKVWRLSAPTTAQTLCCLALLRLSSTTLSITWPTSLGSSTELSDHIFINRCSNWGCLKILSQAIFIKRRIKTIDDNGNEEYLWDLTGYSASSNGVWNEGQLPVTARKVSFDDLLGPIEYNHDSQ